MYELRRILEQLEADLKHWVDVISHRPGMTYENFLTAQSNIAAYERLIDYVKEQLKEEENDDD